MDQTGVRRDAAHARHRRTRRQARTGAPPPRCNLCHMPTAMTAIELSSPQTVDGRGAPYQSLWLLVRLLHAHAAGQPVRLDDLRGQVSAARTLRMLVSRAFRDFK